MTFLTVYVRCRIMIAKVRTTYKLMLYTANKALVRKHRVTERNYV